MHEWLVVRKAKGIVNHSCVLARYRELLPFGWRFRVPEVENNSRQSFVTRQQYQTRADWHHIDSFLSITINRNYRVEHWTGMLLRLVRFPGAARDFCPRVNFQCRVSYGVRTPPCVIACILICAHVKDPVVHVRVRWIIETLKHPACTLGWVARLSQLAFPGESNPNFPCEKSHWDNTVVKIFFKKTSKSLHEQPPVLPMWKLRWRFHLLSLYFCPHGMGTFWCIFDYLPLPANPTPLKVTELSHQQINWPI